MVQMVIMYVVEVLFGLDCTCGIMGARECGWFVGYTWLYMVIHG